MLELKNICKSYKTGDYYQKALHNVNLKFRENEFVAILGPSGSGKTTLLNIIGGLDRYDTGDLIINDVSTKEFKDSTWDAYRNNSVGFIFQSYNLISHISILENVEMGMTLSGVNASIRKEKAVEALRSVGLEKHINKKPNQLSGGQTQRVAIARALVTDPDLILADEPSGALDSNTSIQIMELIKEIAKDTIGFTGADLENLLNEAALLAVRRKKKALTMQEISDATSRVEMGTEKKSHKYSEKAKKLTAYHEAGHAVSSYYIEGHDPVKEISIIPRGMGAGGYTWYTPQEENYNSKADMLDDLISLLGGRVAEALSLNDISTGASNDLQRATSICRDMVSKYGMSDELGPVVYSDDNNEVFLGKDYGHVNNYSEATSARIDEQIEKMMRKAYSQTESILKTHYDKLELVAETLIKNEKISGDQFTQLMENGFIADEKVSENEETQAEDTEIVDGENVNEDDLSSNDTKD